MAELANSISVTINGRNSENSSECEIGGAIYILSGYVLTQELMSPVTLSFSLYKKDHIQESTRDVVYAACASLMGNKIEIRVSTQTFIGDQKTNLLSFKGIVTAVNASRSTAGHASINVTAASNDYLLDGHPNCRSFENQNLQEIVSRVIEPYEEVAADASIQPRYTKKIPYIVQHNESDYAFLVSLAQRFGEWMYNDGERFVFGSIPADQSENVKLNYPDGNMFGYGINMQLRHFNFSHISPNLYKYGEEGGYMKKEAAGECDKKLNNLNEPTYLASQELYKAKTIQNLNVGSFDDGEDEGNEAILDFSTKVQARGEKAQMLISQGNSKVAKLRLGQKFEINDGVVNRSGEKEDVKQEPLMVAGISHVFDYEQEYSNSFTAIPASCDYPPYSTSNVFPYSAPQRATVVDNVDEKKLGRIRVQFPWQAAQDPEMKTPWIRISQPYGGLSKGVQFIPEIGEEVMIGFEMDNAERPYVMGTLFNGRDCPDEDWRADGCEGGTSNNVKAIRTRNGHTIQFCDNAEGGYIQIYDHNKNNYTLTFSTDEQLIRIEAKGNIELLAGKNIQIKAEKDMEITAGNNLTINSGKDTDISADANMSIAAENNMDQKATDLFVKASDAISQESGNSFIIKTNNLQEKAARKAAIDGGSLLEITAGNVKVR